jgi:hypothetical protein
MEMDGNEIAVRAKPRGGWGMNSVKLIKPSQDLRPVVSNVIGEHFELLVDSTPPYQVRIRNNTGLTYDIGIYCLGTEGWELVGPTVFCSSPDELNAKWQAFSARIDSGGRSTKMSDGSK